jgi:hypothetical protein
MSTKRFIAVCLLVALISAFAIPVRWEINEHWSSVRTPLMMVVQCKSRPAQAFMCGFTEDEEVIRWMIFLPCMNEHWPRSCFYLFAEE